MVTNNVSGTFGLSVVEATDQVARAREQETRARRNSDWLEAHWPNLLPQARGRFIAVAGQEAFIADSVEAAWEWVAKVHPEDDGAFVRHVRKDEGPRIYAHRW